MPLSMRNVFIVGIILLLTVLVATGMHMYNGARLKRVNTAITDSQYKLDQIIARNSQAPDEALVMAELKAWQNFSQQNSKQILEQENSDITFAYLNEICRRWCPQVDFSFKSTEDKTNSKNVKVATNRYVVSGKAPMAPLYNFLLHIEDQTRLYTVESLQMHQIHTQDTATKHNSKINNPDARTGGRYRPAEYTQNDSYDQELIARNLVEFSFVLQGYSIDNGIPAINASWRQLKGDTDVSNPFKAGIHAPAYDAKEEGHPKLEDLLLVGISGNQAFFSGPQNTMLVLTRGDKIAYGSLTSIDADNNEVVFTINRIGIEQQIHLTINRN